jgi:HEAT repeat protein
VALDCQDVEFYLQGIHYVQLEPVWGGKADAAVDVRCTCAMGLAATGYSRAVATLTPLLADPEARARAGAARAIACANPHEAEVLLRFKALIGDAEPHVIGEVFNGLLAIAADQNLPFVADHLSHADPSIQEYAALALGESRHPGAFERLRAAWDTVCVTRESRATLIRAAALHRSEAALDWLIAIIEREAQAYADVAVEALAVYDRNSKLMERVRAAQARRTDR